MAQKWVKQPGRGQFRGEGEWMKLEDTGYLEDAWHRYRQTGYLPTAEQDDKPEEN